MTPIPLLFPAVLASNSSIKNGNSRGTMSQIPSLRGVVGPSTLVQQAQHQKDRRNRRQPPHDPPPETAADDATPTSSDIAPSPTDGLDHLDLKA